MAQPGDVSERLSEEWRKTKLTGDERDTLCDVLRENDAFYRLAAVARDTLPAQLEDHPDQTVTVVRLLPPSAATNRMCAAAHDALIIATELGRTEPGQTLPAELDLYIGLPTPAELAESFAAYTDSRDLTEPPHESAELTYVTLTAGKPDVTVGLFNPTTREQREHVLEVVG